MRGIAERLPKGERDGAEIAFAEGSGRAVALDAFQGSKRAREQEEPVASQRAKRMGHGYTPTLDVKTGVSCRLRARARARKLARDFALRRPSSSSRA